MENQQHLEDYIRQQMEKGETPELIKANLLAGGWQEKDIEAGFEIVKNPPVVGISEAEPPKGKKKFILIALVIAGVLLIGGGAFGYFYYQSPEKAFGRMVNKLQEVKSFEYVGTSAFVFNEMKFSVDFSGFSDLLDQANPKGEMKLNLKSDLFPAAVGIDIQALNKTIYLKASNIPKMGSLDLSFFSEQWVRINQDEIAKQFNLDQYQEKYAEEIGGTQDLSVEEKEKLKEIWLNKDNMVIEKLAGEKIEGVGTVHYKFTPKKEKLADALAATLQIRGKELKDEEMSELVKIAEKIQEFSGEIWIGKWNSLPYKASLTLKFQEAKQTTRVDFSVQFKNYDKPVALTAPDSSKSFQEIFTEIMGQELKKTPPLGGSILELLKGDGQKE